MLFPLLTVTPPSADKVWMAVGGVLVAVAALLLDMLRNSVNEWREKRKKAKQTSFVYLAEKQVQLDQATERIRIESAADHVALWRLHNGEFFEGNDSIKKMSMASEAVGGVGLGRWKKDSQAVLMSDYAHLMLGLDRQPYYIMHPDTVLDFEMGRMMNEREYDTVVALLVRGKKQKPLAILFLSWCTRRLEEPDLNTTYLESNRRDLSYTLSD